MDWFDKNFLNTFFKVASLIPLVIITYQLYTYYQTQNQSYYEMQNQNTASANKDSVRLSQFQASVDREIDSIKNLHNTDSQSSFNTHLNLYPEQNDSAASAPVTVSDRKNTTMPDRKNDDSQYTKNAKNTNVLHGPSAYFSREYTIAIGKTIPVTILWADTGATPTNIQLFTIKVDDITDKKARFTIEDPFAVLLFSQTGYAANDKIIIEDERHNIHISVLQVNTNFAVIKIASQLNDNIVSKLRKVG